MLNHQLQVQFGERHVPVDLISVKAKSAKMDFIKMKSEFSTIHNFEEKLAWVLSSANQDGFAFPAMLRFHFFIREDGSVRQIRMRNGLVVSDLIFDKSTFVMLMESYSVGADVIETIFASVPAVKTAKIYLFPQSVAIKQH